MKLRVSLFALSLFLLSIFVVVAQTDIESIEDPWRTAEAAYIQDASRAIFEAVEMPEQANTFTLTLLAVQDETEFIQMKPVFSAGTVGSFDLALYWSSAASRLAPQAVLGTDDFDIFLTLSNPSYVLEEEMATYTARVDAVTIAGTLEVVNKVDFNGKDFSNASLYIYGDEAFESGFLESFERSVADRRDLQDCLNPKWC